MSRISNRVRSAFGYLTGKQITNLFPQVVVIEVTNHCNLDCVMCPHSIMTRPAGTMDISLFRRIIDQLTGQAEIVYLHGLGETLLVKNFDDYILYAREKGLKTLLSTNVSVITENSARKLMASGLDFLIMSIDGSEPRTYEAIRRGGNFEKVINNCKLVVEEKIRQGATTHLTVQLILMEENQFDVGRQKKLFSSRQRRAINSFRTKPVVSSFANNASKVEHTRPCFFPWNQMSITWDGRVNQCCFDFEVSHQLGDTKNENIEDIWNGPEITRTRSLHQSLQLDDIPVCSGCTLPELGYINWVTVSGSAVIPAHIQRKVIPWIESLLLFRNR